MKRLIVCVCVRVCVCQDVTVSDSTDVDVKGTRVKEISELGTRKTKSYFARARVCVCVCVCVCVWPMIRFSLYFPYDLTKDLRKIAASTEGRT